MILDFSGSTETIVIPIILDKSKLYPIIMASTLIPDKAQNIDIFLTSTKHSNQHPQQLIFTEKISVLSNYNVIIDHASFVEEMLSLVTIMKAKSVLLVISAPVAMKVSPDQHLQMECIRRIGWYGDEIQELGVKDFQSWVQSFGLQIDFSKIEQQISAIIKFE